MSRQYEYRDKDGALYTVGHAEHYEYVCERVVDAMHRFHRRFKDLPYGYLRRYRVRIAKRYRASVQYIDHLIQINKAVAIAGAIDDQKLPVSFTYKSTVVTIDPAQRGTTPESIQKWRDYADEIFGMRI